MKENLLTKGPVFKALFVFSLPMIITNTVSILFHAADVAVLSFFAGEADVAAVGACGSLITLMVSLFTALATGANVLISKRIGAGDESGTQKAIGTSLSIGLLSGVLLMLVSLAFARKFLILMNCQPAVLDGATLYMKIYFLGSPIMMLNSFAVAGLRATGDSTHPMIYSMLSGAVNVALNVFFVTVLDLAVAGVAIATVASSAVSLVLVMTRLLAGKERRLVSWRNLRIYWADFWDIVKIGVPTCLCSLSFFLANVVLSSAVNSISTDAMAANSISAQFDGIIYTVGTAIASATSIIVAQNYGAGDLARIRRTVFVGILYAAAISLVLGTLFVVFAEPMLSLLTDSESIIDIAKDRMTFLCLTYFITSIMEVFSFSLRAIKRQVSTMVVGFVCGFCIRCLWRYFVWPANQTLSMLFASYAVSAFVAIMIYLLVYRLALRKIEHEKKIAFI